MATSISVDLDNVASGPTIYLARGADDTIELTFSDSNDATPLASAVLYFAIKKNETDAAATIEKDSNTATEIAITSDTQATIYIDDTDTEGLTPGGFKYDLWRVKATKKHVMIRPTRIVISERITDVP